MTFTTTRLFRCASPIFFYLFVALCVVVPSTEAISAPGELLAVSWFEERPSVIDIQTGAVTELGGQTDSYNAAAVDRSNRYFTVSSPGTLWEIDTETGSRTVLFDIPSTLDYSFISSLASVPGDRLFAVASTPGGGQKLFEIDLTTQVTTFVGFTDIDRITSLTTTNAGELIGYSLDAGLVGVDKTSGLATALTRGFGEKPSIQSIDFAPDGRLIGAGKGFLYEIDRFSGIATQLTAIAGAPDVRGIAFLVPEPTGIASAVVAASLLFGSRRRK